MQDKHIVRKTKSRLGSGMETSGKRIVELGKVWNMQLD